MLGGADNPNGELPSYITGADKIFDLDVAMDRVEGAALEFYEAAARRSVRQVFLEVAEKLSEKVESYLQHQYSFKIENPANKHERPHHKYI